MNDAPRVLTYRGSRFTVTQLQLLASCLARDGFELALTFRDGEWKCEIWTVGQPRALIAAGFHRQALWGALVSAVSKMEKVR